MAAIEGTVVATTNATEETTVVINVVQETETAVEIDVTAPELSLPPAAAKKGKKAAPRCSPAHPPFLEMITEAIVSLKESTGSSQYAITKYIEENQKNLPSNFRKLLLVHLKKLVASDKLVKVKNSYMLPTKPVGRISPIASKPPKAPGARMANKTEPKPKAAPAAEAATPSKTIVKTVSKPKSKPIAAKPKANSKAKPVAVKPKAAGRPKKVAKMADEASPRKKTKTATKPPSDAASKVKKAPAAKSVKKPVTAKTIGKKVQAKKVKK